MRFVRRMLLPLGIVLLVFMFAYEVNRLEGIDYLVVFDGGEEICADTYSCTLSGKCSFDLLDGSVKITPEPFVVEEVEKGC